MGCRCGEKRMSTYSSVQATKQAAGLLPQQPESVPVAPESTRGIEYDNFQSDLIAQAN